MTPTQSYAAALAKADSDYASALQVADKRHDAAAEKAAADLATALAAHDATVAAADTARADSQQSAESTLRSARAKATEAHNRAMRSAVGVEASLEEVPNGALLLRVAGEREPVGRASPNYGGQWKVQLGGDIVFVATETDARRTLWESLVDDQPAAVV